MIWLVAPVLGAVYCLGFAPFDLWPLSLLAVAGFFVVLERDPDRALLCSWLFGIGKYGVGASWIYVSINVYGGASPVLAGFLVLLFVLFVAALFCAPLGYLYRGFRTQSAFSPINCLVFASAWVTMDWLLTWLLTGFPWLYLGNTVVGAPASNPLTHLVPVFGVIGTGWLMALLACSGVALVFLRSRNLVLLALLPLVLGSVLAPFTWVRPETNHTVALVQGNLDQARKWLREEALANVQRHVNLTRAHWDADLVVWPEAAITLFPSAAGNILDDLARQAVVSDTSLILGIPGMEQAQDRVTFQNLAIGLGRASGRFAKYHLVPFGEYVPFEGLLRGLIAFFDLPMSSSSPGRASQPNIESHVGEVAMAICYEIAYPESMRKKATQAAVLATISNDTWFGASLGPHQHMQIAQARAQENGRYLLRATNNGVTAIVDHLGRQQASLPQFEASTLRGTFAVMSGRTPYNRWGHWPGLMACLLCFVLAYRQRRTEDPGGIGRDHSMGR